MNTKALPFLFICALSLNAQVLEKTILLPDSLGGMVNPRCCAYNQINNRLYVAGQDGEATIVIDCATNQVLTTIPAGLVPGFALWVQNGNRTFVANSEGASISVIAGNIGLAEGFRTGTGTGLISIQPNPFRQKTTIKLSSNPQTELPCLRIFDPTGRLIRVLKPQPDNKTFIWDGTDELGRRLGTGVYIGITADQQVRLIIIH